MQEQRRRDYYQSCCSLHACCCSAPHWIAHAAAATSQGWAPICIDPSRRHSSWTGKLLWRSHSWRSLHPWTTSMATVRFSRSPHARESQLRQSETTFEALELQRHHQAGTERRRQRWKEIFLQMQKRKKTVGTLSSCPWPVRFRLLSLSRSLTLACQHACFSVCVSLSLCFFNFSGLLWRARFVLSSNSICIVGESCNGCCLSSTTHHPGFYYHDFRAIVYDGWRRKEEINPTAATTLHSAFFVSSSAVENHFFLRSAIQLSLLWPVFLFSCICGIVGASSYSLAAMSNDKIESGKFVTANGCCELLAKKITTESSFLPSQCFQKWKETQDTTLCGLMKSSMRNCWWQPLSLHFMMKVMVWWSFEWHSQGYDRTQFLDVGWFWFAASDAKPSNCCCWMFFPLQFHTCELIQEGERFFMLGFVARRSLWGDLCQVWGLGFSQWELWMVATLTAFHDEVLMTLYEWSDTHKVMTVLILDMGWFRFQWIWHKAFYLQSVLLNYFSLQSHTSELVQEGKILGFFMLDFVARRSLWGDLCRE